MNFKISVKLKYPRIEERSIEFRNFARMGEPETFTLTTILRAFTIHWPYQKRLLETKLHAAAKDRIGKLPNGVPCHILSFLHTKGTVKTTVLSTRWMNVWAFTPNLNFNDRDLRWLDSAAFMGFVDHVLLFHGSLNIHKFSLRWSDAEDLACIVGWIHIRHNVVERDLLHLYVNDVADGLFELPQCPVTSKTLVVLKLM
ncbi:hypothetical protein ACFX2H_030865 [Malus domestica]